MGAAFIASAGTIIGATQSLLGGNAKDSERLAANAAALTAANAGNANALAFLKQRTGQFGVVYVPGYGETGGWATEIARADAKVKYSSALAVRSGQGVMADIGETVQNVAQQTGHTIVSGTKNELVWIALAVVVGVFLLARFTRKG